MYKILVAIANHGVKNQAYLNHLLTTYRSFDMCVDIVVLSDREKDLGDDVEVLVGAPSANPWSLPFAHRKLFVERKNDYDLYIYSEDDTEITEDHVLFFMEQSNQLPASKILGFLRYEIGPDGQKYISTAHGHFHWDISSIFNVAGRTYANYTNEHSASYILTKLQLKKCIQSGGFDVEPHEGRYDMLCSAATDPYTNCGFEKTVCISEFQRSLLHHLPDVYLGRIGEKAEYVDVQVDRILELAANPNLPRTELINPRTKFVSHYFDKGYSEPTKSEWMLTVESPRSRVLFVGSEAGRNERQLVDDGHTVYAIPLDEIVSASTANIGATVLPADLDRALEMLDGIEFDYILVTDVIRYVKDPAEFLKKILKVSKSDTKLSFEFENPFYVKAVKRLLFERRGFLMLANMETYKNFGIQSLHTRNWQRWLKSAGLKTFVKRLVISDSRSQKLGVFEPAFKLFLAHSVVYVVEKL